MPDTRPRIEFDDEGVCNACHTAEKKNHIDWDARRQEFLDLVDQFRAKDGPYDCV
ncbi:MAG: N-acetyl sugar amidotransferase, partial [Rhodospirillales bacterium]|nr:N-acetyl sugar amidotransferase [Rhodospirillales bacterium]